MAKNYFLKFLFWQFKEKTSLTRSLHPSLIKFYTKGTMTNNHNSNDTKTEISLKLNVTKIEKSPKLKCRQNLIVTKTEISPKMKCRKN